MINQNFILFQHTSAREALRKLDMLGVNGSVLFIVNPQNKVLGTLTDGDIRRGLIKNLHIDDVVDHFMNPNFHFLTEGAFTNKDISKLKKQKINFAPLLNKQGEMIRVVDISALRSYLPLHAVIMAGGKGERLKPLTLATPKPMLIVGDKPIIEHNIDRLIQYGIQHITISVCYLKEQIMDYFGDGNKKGITIDYIIEETPLGTIGALSLIPKFSQEHILVMNSDILTNLDFGDFFESYQQHAAEMIVATTPYQVNVPFAVMEVTVDNEVKGFAEKPKYTFYSNAGIYILQKAIVPLIPANTYYHATDMMNAVLKKGFKLVSGPILGYWLDIGRMEDFNKAQEDIKHLSF